MFRSRLRLARSRAAAAASRSTAPSNSRTSPLIRRRMRGASSAHLFFMKRAGGMVELAPASFGQENVRTVTSKPPGAVDQGPDAYGDFSQESVGRRAVRRRALASPGRPVGRGREALPPNLRPA